MVGVVRVYCSKKIEVSTNSVELMLDAIKA
jgi:hypothetical protein